MTYVRRDPRIRAYQLRGAWAACWDLAFVEISVHQFAIKVLNVYNAPQGSEDAGAAVKHIVHRCPIEREVHTIVAGDFNLKHPSWQPGASSSGRAAEDLLASAEEHTMSLCLPPGSRHAAKT